ncbi:S8 family serine peptidase [Kineococcus sp. SYSU DK004]|uniref:S8 family serine peptidase n=1 Tax=Kineococcus sp. SYSU DK004 TaxID=3383125 RepID=UPI003D7DEC16
MPRTTTTRTTTTSTRRTLATGAALAAAISLTVGAPHAGAAPTASSATAGTSATAAAAVPMNYTVNVAKANRGQTLKVERAVTAAGGTVVQSWAEIGVVVAQSGRSDFAERLRAEKAVESVGATRTAAVVETDPTWEISDPLRPGEPGRGNARTLAQRTGNVEDATTAVPDPREGEQWDLQLIGADAAHQVTDGSRDVLVAVLDSGIEGGHPDLAPNVDTAASASCLSGVPDTSYAAWQPTTSDHGTHVAGTIAAARNGIGIVGVAPGVRMSAVKVVNDDGFIFAEAAICGFMHAAATGADITNNSYYIDPWQFWCDDDADQRAVKTAVQRAVRYTQDRGIANVAAAGNSNVDLANKTVDTSSPNDSTPVSRPIGNDCLDIPAEVEGVVTVSSTDRSGAKSSFSNYGDGVVDVAAPGRAILSTVLGGGYGTKSGTSMASPHAAGVLALVKSAHPELSGAQLVERLEQQATDVPCPAGVQQCTGTKERNGFFGEGLVNAAAAVR